MCTDNTACTVNHTRKHAMHRAVILNILIIVFTALHGMQSSDENSVHPSVKREDCDKMEQKFFEIFKSI